MIGRRRKRRIKEIILTVGDYEEIFELNNNEGFKQKKEIIMQRCRKMLEKIKEYEQNKQIDQANNHTELPKKEEKNEFDDDLFHDLFSNKLKDEIDFFNIEIQENGSLMNVVNKPNHIC